MHSLRAEAVPTLQNHIKSIPYASVAENSRQSSKDMYALYWSDAQLVCAFQCSAKTFAPQNRSRLPKVRFC